MADNIRVTDRLVTFVNNQSAKLITERTTIIEDNLLASQREVFDTLADKLSAGLASPPQLGQFTPRWFPLGDEYKKRKKKYFGRSGNSFFLGKLGTDPGGLADALESFDFQDIEDVTVDYTPHGNSGIKAKLIHTRGSRKSIAFFGARGLVKQSESNLKKIGRINFSMFVEELDLEGPSTAVDNFLFGEDKKIIPKLYNSEQMYRPLIKPFLQWFAKVEGTRAVNAGLKGVKRGALGR